MASASATAKARPAVKARQLRPLAPAVRAELHRRASQLRPLAPAVTASQARPKARPAVKAKGVVPGKRASAVKGIQLRPKSCFPVKQASAATAFRATQPASKGASATKTASATNTGSKGSHKGASATETTGNGGFG